MAKREIGIFSVSKWDVEDHETKHFIFEMFSK